MLISPNQSLPVDQAPPPYHPTSELIRSFRTFLLSSPCPPVQCPQQSTWRGLRRQDPPVLFRKEPPAPSCGVPQDFKRRILSRSGKMGLTGVPMTSSLEGRRESMHEFRPPHTTPEDSIVRNLFLTLLSNHTGHAVPALGRYQEALNSNPWFATGGRTRDPYQALFVSGRSITFNVGKSKAFPAW